MVTTTWTQTAGMTSETGTDNIEDYAEQAEASKDAAAASETASANSAAASASSASGASTSAAEALASKNAAATSETNAAASASTATTQASNSSTSATASETSRVASVAAQAAAETAETAAETAQAAAEAAEAGVAADAATATAQAAIATTQAANSGTSATASEASRVAAVAAQAAAETAETNAETAETNAETAQTAAEAAETSASGFSTSASASASTATTQAGIATTKAGEAAASATASASSATASEAAKDAALSALDNFQDQYLGDFATDPTTDNDGDPLQAGMLYFNTTDDVMKVYTGSAWVAAYASLSGALLTSNNLSDLVNAATARTNLGLGTAATTASTDYATAAQGTLADSAVQPSDSPTFGSVTVTGTVDGRDVAADGTKLDGIEASADVTDAANVTAAGAAMETGADFTGNVTFGDNDKAIFGAGSDLQVYHDGNHSIIKDAGTGNLQINAGNFNVNNVANSANIIVGNDGGAVNLYYDGSKKLATTSTGVDITGSVTVSGTVDGRDVATDGAKLDGIEAGATADQTAAQILTAVKTVDGSGSGLDADTVDGLQASSFLRSDASDTMTGNLTLNGTLALGSNSINDVENVYVRNKVIHDGDTDTHILFGTNTITLATGGSSEITVNTTGVRLGDTGNGYFQPVSGNYGSIQIDGGGHGGWEGYSIGGRAVFMHNNGTETGIYNDADNEWLIKLNHNGSTHLYYDGSSKLETSSNGIEMSGRIDMNNNDIYGVDQLFHHGDTNTYMQFHAADQWRVVTGGTERIEVNNSRTQIDTLLTDAAVGEDYDALSGTSVTADPDAGGAFSLTMTGPTSFTFGAPSLGSGVSTGFIIELTGNGSTVIWPSSVEWAGGTAPDAPASGETDIYVFWTRNGGTTWYGVQSIDAAA